MITAPSTTAPSAANNGVSVARASAATSSAATANQASVFSGRSSTSGGCLGTSVGMPSWSGRRSSAPPPAASPAVSPMSPAVSPMSPGGGTAAAGRGAADGSSMAMAHGTADSAPPPTTDRGHLWIVPTLVARCRHCAWPIHSLWTTLVVVTFAYTDRHRTSSNPRRSRGSATTCSEVNRIHRPLAAPPYGYLRVELCPQSCGELPGCQGRGCSGRCPRPDRLAVLRGGHDPAEDQGQSPTR